MWRTHGTRHTPSEAFQRLPQGGVFDGIKFLFVNGFVGKGRGARARLCQRHRLDHLEARHGAITKKAVDAQNDAGRFIL